MDTLAVDLTLDEEYLDPEDLDNYPPEEVSFAFDSGT